MWHPEVNHLGGWVLSGKKWTDEQRETFLIRLAQTGNVSVAARSIGLSRSGAYSKRDNDPEFAAEWDNSIAESIDALHEAARIRAEDGVPEPVYYQGVVCGTVQKYSDTLLCLLMKAHDPRFRDHVKLDHSTPEGVQVQTTPAIDMTIYSDEQRENLQSLIHMQLQAKGSGE